MPIDSVRLLNMGDKARARKEALQELATFLVDGQAWSQVSQIDKWLGKDAPEGDAARRGICLALCLYWIDARRRNKEELRGGEFGTLSKSHVMKAAAKIQELYAASLEAAVADGEARAKAERDAIQLVGSALDIAIEGDDTGDANGQSMRPFVPRHGKYGLVALKGFNCGHALAIYSQKSGLLKKHHFHVFDPNWGEFRMEDSRFEEFLDLLTLTYRLHGPTYSKASLYRLAV
ncbi:MAG: YopT-type cysteine protease domain-containing protein [Geminicoccaceae bacterium]